MAVLAGGRKGETRCLRHIKFLRPGPILRREPTRGRRGRPRRMLHPSNFAPGAMPVAAWSAAGGIRPATWLLFDRSGNCIDALVENPAVLTTGAADVLGRPFQKLLPAAVVPLAEGLWATLRAGGQPGPVSCVQEFGGEAGRTEISLSPSAAGNVLVHFREARRQETNPGADPNRRLLLAVQAARLGIWEWDLASGKIAWDAGMASIYGLPNGGADPSDWQWERWVLPDDLPEAAAALNRALEDSLASRFRQAFRIRRPDGMVRSVRSHGVIERDGYGRAVRVTGINTDITEEHSLQEDLERASTRLQTATAALSLGIWELDPATGLETWDDRTLALFDVNRAQFTSARDVWFLRVHPEDREAGWETRIGSLAQPSVGHFEQSFRVLTAAGETRWLRSSANIQRRSDGTAVRVVGVNSDITEQQVAAERLSDLSNRLLLAQRAGGLGVLDWDITADRMLWNDRMFELFDVPHPSSADVVNARNLWRSRLHPEDAEAAERDLQDAAEGRRRYDAEFRLLTRSGETRHLKGDALVETDADGTPRRLVGVYHDVTGAVEARNRLRQDAEILRQVGELAHIGGWEFQPQSGRLWWSEEVFRLHELPPGRQPGLEEAFRFFTEEAAAKVRGAFGRLCATGEAFDLRVPFITANGRPCWVRVIGRAELKLGRVLRVYGTLQDVSAEKHSEQALITAREAAEAASRAKSEFLATVSHELRTPLNGILGFTQLLEDSELCEADREYVRFITTAGEALLGIISDLLDFSRIEAGRLTLEYSTFAVPALLQESLELIRPRAREKGLELKLSVDPSVGIMRGDRCRLRQITLNLLSNAVKFTENGAVSLRCTPYVAGHIKVDVTDTGIGIPADKQDRLFQRFSQADSSTTRKFGGTGLGLAICKQLLEKMGGQIGLQSDPGHGSTFWFIIPVRPPESGQEEVPELEIEGQ